MPLFNYKESKIAYSLVGEGNPLVLVHGFSIDSRMWKPQIEFFKNKYQVITYDMRGFGSSSLPISRYSHHDDLKAFLDYLNIKKVNIVGLSLGGEISLDFTLMYPEYVNKLILLDSSLSGYSSTVDWNVYAKEQGLEKAKENWLNHNVFKSARNKPLALQLLTEMVHDYSGWHWLNFDPREKPKAIEKLSEIKCPVEIILGQNDLDYYHDIAKILNESIKNSNLDIIDDSGHMVNLEQSEKTNHIIDDFLQNL
jgi:pimeloyl-ACP methyl ester carboxylesterase